MHAVNYYVLWSRNLPATIGNASGVIFCVCGSSMLRNEVVMVSGVEFLPLRIVSPICQFLAGLFCPLHSVPNPTSVRKLVRLLPVWKKRAMQWQKAFC